MNQHCLSEVKTLLLSDNTGIEVSNSRMYFIQRFSAYLALVSLCNRGAVHLNNAYRISCETKEDTYENNLLCDNPLKEYSYCEQNGAYSKYNLTAPIKFSVFQHTKLFLTFHLIIHG